MELDNSRANAFRECPYKYFEMYEAEGTGLEPVPRIDNEYSALDFGARMHELWEEHFKEMKGDPRPPYPESLNGVLESEAQVVLAAYKAHYPIETFEIVDVEKTFRVALPNSHHIYIGKIDLVHRENGILDITDHKSQDASAKSNLPQKWAARDQASLYLWAAEQIYKEPVGNFFVDVAIRPSPKGQRGPQFPERQRLERTPEQIALAIRDLIWVADQIEAMRERFGNHAPWPANREECYTWYPCPYYLPHTFGWSPEIREYKYQPKKEYLQLAGIKVIQPYSELEAACEGREK